MNRSSILKGIVLSLALAGGLAGQAASVAQRQNVSLQQGWNAVYLTVTPEASVDEVFADWPVEKVGVYDPSSYLETKQYSGTDTTEGTSAAGFRMWYRDEPALSQVQRVIANAVYVCYATNAWSGVLYGRPAAPRITWHPSATNEPMNFVGFSLAAGTTTTLGDYFDGLDAGCVNYMKSYAVQGMNPAKAPVSALTASTTFAHGQVVVMTCTKATDWSGVLNVSPMSGLDFSTNVNYRVLDVRNDGAKARTVRISLGAGDDAGGGLPPVPTGLLVRDGAFSTNEWLRFESGDAFEKRLAAGETLKLEVAVDRTRFETPAGFYYGGLVTILDRDGGSNMRVTVPVEVTSDHGAAIGSAWPKGMWLASGELDTVTYLHGQEAAVDAKAGGRMKVRLPLYVAADGTMSLLQRFIHGVDTNGNTHVFSARVDESFPVAIANVKRVSSSVLPIDEPVIGILPTINSTFGTQATFGFTVGENSRVNPFRHAFHPSHDGYTWDFTTPTPSGDDFQNYVATVKPEMFSVTNRITFVWDPSTGSRWTPVETLTGSLVWEFDGIRHEGTIQAKGTFTMKRISAADLDR